MEDRTFLSVRKSNREIAHAKIFYTQIIFTILTFGFGSRGLLYQNIPFFAWLPALLLLFDATLSFASLLYLDFTRRNTNCYLRLVLSLVVFRLSCCFLLASELFLPHSDPFVSIPLILIAISHCTFSLISTVHVHNLTEQNKSTSESKTEGEIFKLNPCLGSTTTLVTNIEDDII